MRGTAFPSHLHTGEDLESRYYNDCLFESHLLSVGQRRAPWVGQVLWLLAPTWLTAESLRLCRIWVHAFSKPGLSHAGAVQPWHHVPPRTNSDFFPFPLEDTDSFSSCQSETVCQGELNVSLCSSSGWGLKLLKEEWDGISETTGKNICDTCEILVFHMWACGMMVGTGGGMNVQLLGSQLRGGAEKSFTYLFTIMEEKNWWKEKSPVFFFF